MFSGNTASFKCTNMEYLYVLNSIAVQWSNIKYCFFVWTEMMENVKIYTEI